MRINLRRMKELCEAFEKTGRVTHIYPNKRKVSLSGGCLRSFEDAAETISDCLTKLRRSEP